MIFQAHRGISTEAPENTLPAMELAIAQGYKFLETDVSVTKDGCFVLMHDSTINRTGRHNDGTKIDKPIALKNITYQELLNYDFGIGFSKKYTGTRAPLFEDILKLAKQNNAVVKIDSKYTKMPILTQIKFFKFLRPYKDIIMITCDRLWQIKFASLFLPDVAVGYDGKISEKILTKINKIVPKERLFIWVPYKNEHTSWAHVDFLSDGTAKLAKSHGKLGVWILSKEEEFETAMRLGADAIETAGELKPPQNIGIIPDTHSHTLHSHDAHFLMSEMRDAAAQKGIDFLTVTDHCDVFACKEQDIYTPIAQSYEDVQSLNSSNDCKTKLLSGVEIGEGFWYPDANLKIQKLKPYDQIIGSVHGVKRDNAKDCSYALVDFSTYTAEEINAFLHDYFRDMKMLLQTTDFDVLAHITCPIRYITGKYGIKVDIALFLPEIKEILEYIINHGIAMEVNTSAFRKIGDFMPSKEIINLYKNLGGYLITLGADAHMPENIGASFEEALAFLKECGYQNIFYFKNRKPIPCRIA